MLNDTRYEEMTVSQSSAMALFDMMCSNHGS